MEIGLLKRGVVQSLYDGIEKNLDRYVEGDFEDLLPDEFRRTIRGTNFELADLSSLNPEVGGEHDAENSFIAFTALKDLSPYQARDERVWAYFTHLPCLEYSRKRWLSKSRTKERTLQDIRSHFFARGGHRGFERNNAIACLWWWGFVASRYERASLEETLEAFLHQTDVRSSIIERPTTSRSAKVFSAIMDALIKRKFANPNPQFFARRGNKGIYREWLKEINRHGGVKLFDSRNENDLTALFEELAVSAEQNAVAQ